MRPKPHIDSEYMAVGGLLGDGFDKIFADLVKVFRVGNAAGSGLRARPLRISIFRIDEYQIDVGTKIELAPAQFSHADDDEGGFGAVFLGRGTEPPQCLAPSDCERSFEHGLREASQIRRHVFDGIVID